MIINNVKVINFDEVIKNADIEVKGNKIFKITKKKGSGKLILVPGFIDQHIHGFSGHDVMDGKEAIEIMSRELVKKGTTSFLPTVMTASNLKQSLKEAANAKEVNARILGIHMEGPFISKEKKGAHNEKYIQKATAKRIEDYLKMSGNSVRKMTIAPENFDIGLLKILVKNNIIPSLGHSNVSGIVAKKYFVSGVSSVTHLWNAMTGVKNRDTGIAGETLINDSVTTEMILDFVHVDKDTAKLSIDAKGVETVALVTDSIRPAGLPDGESLSGGLKVIKKGNLITLKGTDTIAGSGATMYNNFKHVLELGYDIETAVALTSYNAATILGEENLGVIKKGYLADFILMDKEFNIKCVYVNGKERYCENCNC